jgi:hypothetical protein
MTDMTLARSMPAPRTPFSGPELAVRIAVTLGGLAILSPGHLPADTRRRCGTALGLALARRGMPLERVLIWPLYIGAFPMSFLALVPVLLVNSPLEEAASALFRSGGPLYLTVLAAVVVAASLAQSRRVEPFLSKPLLDVFGSADSAANGASGRPAVPVVLTALALAAVAVVPHLLEAWLDVSMPPMITGISITAAVGIILGMKSLLPGLRA